MTHDPRFTRLLSQDEINAAMEGYPRPIRRSPIRIRHVFIAVFATGLFCGLMVADPLARMVEFAQ